MTLNPLFHSVRSFQDFVDTYRAHYPEHKMTRNDFVRCARILHNYHTGGCHTLELRYSYLNISQSSEPVFRSKMNKMLRTLGLMNANGNIRLVYSDMNYCLIRFEAVRIQGESSFISSIIRSEGTYNPHPDIGGRGQDRTEARHNRSHRCDRLAAVLRTERAPRSRTRNNVCSVEQQLELVTSPTILDGFNPFEGVDNEVFIALINEAR